MRWFFVILYKSWHIKSNIQNSGKESKCRNLVSGRALITELVAGFLLFDAFYPVDFADYFLLKPLSVLIGAISLMPAGFGIESYRLATLFGWLGNDAIGLAAGIINVRFLTIVMITLVGQITLAFFYRKKKA